MAESDMRRPVLLDTDIGTDVDDLLALALLVGAPEVQLIGVTTVYGDTVLRARMTRLVLDQMERRAVPIGIGARETLTGRPVWWAGHEGQGIPGSTGYRLMRASPRRTCSTRPRPNIGGAWSCSPLDR